MLTIGDLGCANVDVESWRKLNRAPLFSGKVNRWILVRTLRDNPTPDDLKRTLAAVFAKWFEGSGVDVMLPYKDSTRSATADLIRLERTSRERLSFPDVARRREDLSGVQPLLRTGDVVWLEVSFAYRGQLLDMPWPVRTESPLPLRSAHECPLDADWMLDSVAKPSEDAPPELSSGEKAADVVADSANEIKERALSALWLPALVLGLGAVLYFSLTGRTYGHA